MLWRLLNQAEDRMALGTFVQPLTTKDQVLEARLEALELACGGLWELLKTKHGYSDEELVRVIHELDARDGVMDGRVTPLKENCPNCGRQLVTKQRKRCVWCGAELALKPF
jgi:hypothetical protein